METNWLGNNRYINLQVQMIFMRMSVLVMILIFFIVFIITVGTVFGEDFSISIDKNDYYLAGRQGVIELTIDNMGRSDWFTISVLGEDEWIKEENALAQIASGESKIINLIVDIPKGIAPMIKGYFLTVTRVSGGEPLPTQTLLINIRQPAPAIVKDFELSCQMCEGKQLIVFGAVMNTGNQPRDITLRIDIPGIGTREIPMGMVSLRGEKAFSETFSLSDKDPEDYQVNVYLSDETGEIYDDSIEFTIPVFKNIVYDKLVSSTIFGNFITLTATNEGNMGSDAEFTSEISDEWYTVYSGSEPRLKEGNNYLWVSSLDPGQSVQVSYTEIFWPTYLFILIAVSMIGYTYYSITSLTLLKKIERPFVKRGAHTSVSLHIKNRRRNVKGAIVRDMIPHGFEAVSKFQTIKPVIRKAGLGTELVWRIGNINPYEERVLHYTVKPTKALGKTRLPSASISAMHRGKPIYKTSNTLFLEALEKETGVFPVTIE